MNSYKNRKQSKDIDFRYDAKIFFAYEKYKDVVLMLLYA